MPKMQIEQAPFALEAALSVRQLVHEWITDKFVNPPGAFHRIH